tara:strand:+ start:328 stop:486 length:159 start_codon:yes stop_codon:yes gene_type:complete
MVVTVFIWPEICFELLIWAFAEEVVMIAALNAMKYLFMFEKEGKFNIKNWLS